MAPTHAAKSKIKDPVLHSDRKARDLEPCTVDNSHYHMTNDQGVNIENTDNWLKCGSNERVGPHLLEDVSALQKVGLPGSLLPLIYRQMVANSMAYRFNVSIMRGSLNVLSMQEEPVPLVPSDCMKVQQMSPRLLFSQTHPVKLRSLSGSQRCKEARDVLIQSVMCVGLL